MTNRESRLRNSIGKIQDFLQREVTAHVSDIKTLEPPPDRVVGALTIGEFSWGPSCELSAPIRSLWGRRPIAGHDVPQMIGKMAQVELDHGGKKPGRNFMQRWLSNVLGQT